MNWADAKEIGAALAATIKHDVQGRVCILIDVPGTNYNEREAILRALARELENRGAVVHHLNGRKRLDQLTHQTPNQNPTSHAEAPKGAQADESRRSGDHAAQAERGAQ